MGFDAKVVQDQLQAGFDLPAEKKFYFNGFAFTITPPDCTFVLTNNNQPVVLLNASHTITKSLAMALLSIINEFEKNNNQKILTLDEIESHIPDIK